MKGYKINDVIMYIMNDGNYIRNLKFRVKKLSQREGGGGRFCLHSQTRFGRSIFATCCDKSSNSENISRC